VRRVTIETRDCPFDDFGEQYASGLSKMSKIGLFNLNEKKNEKFNFIRHHIVFIFSYISGREITSRSILLEKHVR